MAKSGAPAVPQKPPTKQQAVQKVDVHVSPKECFVWYANSKDGWTPIPGTGCAHYVSHKLGITGNGAKCDAGYLFRVPDLVSGLAAVDVKDVAVNDIWTNGGKTHTGVVVEIVNDPKGRDFIIEHCSSAQHGVVRNNWKQKFSGQGRFYRPSLTNSSQGAGGSTSARTSGFPVTEAFS